MMTFIGFIFSSLLLKDQGAVLKSAPELIEIVGWTYQLETYLNRDFIPICPPNGQPLFVIITVISNDSQKFPTSIDIERLWIIKGGEVWETTELSNYDREIPENQLRKIVRNGPKWDPGIYIDVVVQLVYENNAYLLRAAEQLIKMSF